MNMLLPYQVQCSERDFIIMATSHIHAYQELIKERPEYENTSMLITPMFDKRV